MLPVENQMATPNDLRGWNGVLNTSMVIVSCLYIAVGFFGYLQYGEGVLGSVTLNLPVDEWSVRWHTTYTQFVPQGSGKSNSVTFVPWTQC